MLVFAYSEPDDSEFPENIEIAITIKMMIPITISITLNFKLLLFVSLSKVRLTGSWKKGKRAFERGTF